MTISLIFFDIVILVVLIDKHSSHLIHTHVKSCSHHTATQHSVHDLLGHNSNIYSGTLIFDVLIDIIITIHEEQILVGRERGIAKY